MASDRTLARRPMLSALASLLLAGRCGVAHAATGQADPATPGLNPVMLDATRFRARALTSLHSLLVARHGRELLAERVRGAGLDAPVNVKSVSKSVIAALVGRAIAEGVLAGVDQPIVGVLGPLVPVNADLRVGSITVDHLLTMRAGLERTSGRNYGRWVASADWVRHVLSRPFVAEPGGRMLYSTGSYHLLSVALTEATGQSTLELARRWLGAPLGIEVPPWSRDPQGYYLGGNNMALAPRALLRLGELYRQGGMHDGAQVLPASWVDASWTPRTRSRFTGHAYGYGWFLARARGYEVAYAWGYGGQMIYVVPALGITAAITSDPNAPSGRTGYVRQLHRLLADDLIPAAEEA